MISYHVRRQWVTQQICQEGVWPTPRAIQERFGCSRASATRDLAAVEVTLTDPATLQQLQRRTQVQVWYQLQQRLPDLSNRELIRLGTVTPPRARDAVHRPPRPSATQSAPLDVAAIVAKYGGVIDEHARICARQDSVDS
jgi:hypothetical protein